MPAASFQSLARALHPSPCRRSPRVPRSRTPGGRPRALTHGRESLPDVLVATDMCGSQREAKEKDEDKKRRLFQPIIIAAPTRILPSARDCPVAADGDVHLVWRWLDPAIRPPPSAASEQSPLFGILPPCQHISDASRELASTPMLLAGWRLSAQDDKQWLCWTFHRLRAHRLFSRNLGPDWPRRWLCSALLTARTRPAAGIYQRISQALTVLSKAHHALHPLPRPLRSPPRRTGIR